MNAKGFPFLIFCKGISTDFKPSLNSVCCSTYVQKMFRAIKIAINDCSGKILLEIFSHKACEHLSSLLDALPTKGMVSCIFIPPFTILIQ